SEPQFPQSVKEGELGRELLRRLTKWKGFEEMKESRKNILLDILYDGIVFAVEKGFPWPAVVEVARFTEELLEETKDCSITQALKVLGKKLKEYETKFNPSNLMAVCDYFHNTFIRHLKLYQYVLCKDQDVYQTKESVDLCPPPPPLPLSEGVDKEVQQYQQKVAELTAAEVQKRTNMLLLRETLHLERGHSMQKIFEELDLKDMEVLDREALENIIRRAIHTQIESLKELLENEIKTTYTILDLKLQKKTLKAPLPYPPEPSQASQVEPKKEKNKKTKEKKKNRRLAPHLRNAD
uniref:Chromosome 8 open reading frame 74 n=1 Tax=Vombatus ursinus TaxID=29139 RepID=A0A4X2LCI7_VOMUR